MRGFAASFIIVIAIIVVVVQSVFIVDQREKAIVSRFGTIVKTVEEPGLNFRLPFIDEVTYYDNRLLLLDSDEFEVTFNDNRRLIVDAFSRYRIKDVVKYHLAIRGVAGSAQGNLAGIVEKSLRAVLGQVDTSAVLSADRTRLMADIMSATVADAEDIGVEMVDVRIVRADLPDANLQATFDRMSAERKQEAADERARGNEAARRITAAAEREAVQTVSDARRQAEIIKGQADAEANGIFAQAYGQNPEFFDFYRSLQAYEKSLQGSNTSFMMSPESDYYRYLESENGAQ